MPARLNQESRIDKFLLLWPLDAVSTIGGYKHGYKIGCNIRVETLSACRHLLSVGQSKFASWLFLRSQCE